MIRIFVKHVPRLVRQHLPSVQTLDATAAVEALEDAASLKERDCHVDDFIKQCVSRVLALLPDLRVSGMIRALFAYKRAEVPTHPFVEEVATFLLEECGQGGLYVGFLDACTANDVLLLYNAFAVNDYLDVRLYTLCMGMLAAQTPHMLPSDCCVFFRSHVKYLKILEQCRLTGAGKPVPLNRILSPPLVIEVTLRFLEQDDATPDDLTTFIKWLVPMSHFYVSCRHRRCLTDPPGHKRPDGRPGSQAAFGFIAEARHLQRRPYPPYHPEHMPGPQVHRAAGLLRGTDPYREPAARGREVPSTRETCNVPTQAQRRAHLRVRLGHFSCTGHGGHLAVRSRQRAAVHDHQQPGVRGRRQSSAKHRQPQARGRQITDCRASADVNRVHHRPVPARGGGAEGVHIHQKVTLPQLQDMVEKLEAHEQAATTRELGESGHKTAQHFPRSDPDARAATGADAARAMFLSARTRWLSLTGLASNLLQLVCIASAIAIALNGVAGLPLRRTRLRERPVSPRQGFRRNPAPGSAFLRPSAHRNRDACQCEPLKLQEPPSGPPEPRLFQLGGTPVAQFHTGHSLQGGRSWHQGGHPALQTNSYTNAGYPGSAFQAEGRYYNGYSGATFTDGNQNGYPPLAPPVDSYGPTPYVPLRYQKPATYAPSTLRQAYGANPGYGHAAGAAAPADYFGWPSPQRAPPYGRYNPTPTTYGAAPAANRAIYTAPTAPVAGGVYGSERRRLPKSDDYRDNGPSNLTHKEYFSSFRVYSDITWMNDHTPHDEWPGVSKLKHGEVFDVIIRHWMTPVHCVVLSVDKMAECCLVADGVPLSLSTPTMREHFRIDQVVQVKLKWPQEYDDKGRPIVVMSFDGQDAAPTYRVGQLAWATPLMIKGNMAILRLDNSQHLALLFLCELGAQVVDNKRYHFGDFLDKGERIQLQLTHAPMFPRHVTYRARVPWNSPRRLEWASRHPDIKELIAPCEYNPKFVPELFDKPYFSPFGAAMSHRPRETRDFTSLISADSELYALLPTAAEPLSISEFTRRIGGKLKDVLRFLLLQAKAPIDPKAHLPVNVAKSVYNFVTKRTEFNDIDEYALREELEQLSAKHVVRNLERPPVVVLMGHINHGKTALFDMLTDGSNVGSEPGHITQTVRAHMLAGDCAMTLIDTPGHEVFDAMRRCGATIADIALIVVDVMEGLMKQTRESIKLCRNLDIPFIIAATKCDLPNAQPRTEELALQLSEVGVLIEGLGGDTQFLQVSARQDTANSKSALLNAIMLQAAASDDHVLTEAHGTSGRGFVLESGRGNRSSPFCLAILKQGSAAKGSYFVSGKSSVKIRGIKTPEGKRLSLAKPSQAVLLDGFDGDFLPTPGQPFVIYDDEDHARYLTDQRIRDDLDQVAASALQRGIYEGMDVLEERVLPDSTLRRVPVLLKSETQGSVEALRRAVATLKVEGMSSTAVYDILEASAGPIYRSDVLAAYDSGAVILGLGSSLRSDAKADAKKHDVTILISDVIYDLMEQARVALEQRLGDRVLTALYGVARVLKVFDAAKSSKAAGCVVSKGKILRDSAIRVLRQGKPIYAGKLASLRHTKDSADEAVEAQSCGMTFDGWNDVQVDDIVESYAP
ncbi:Translation initiation factor IF-2 [Babesia caballi]|uniref:Translation initiation factor IF-2 n=1 Tax=Babesia caballi TaxID=5871 RepID=A0AAV4LXL1_BABCB|nr:Translation initiation factor IF-2 [Babesia caballi]